jgi:alkylated DNA repair protein (DNA oxidative demethylase)
MNGLSTAGGALPAGLPDRRQLGEQAWLLKGYASARMPEILAGLASIEKAAPFRHMVTPGGRSMSVALTNCGHVGWTSDRHGYRYSTNDPLTGKPWPPMPESFARLATDSAAAAAFGGFAPDACLINRYVPGARLSLHQDRDELDFTQPIVSVSLGLGAIFLFGGMSRGERPARVLLEHGDVVVWGGVDRLRFHGVMPLKDTPGSLFEDNPSAESLFEDNPSAESLSADSRFEGPGGAMPARQRINLTFRKAR